MTEDSNERSYTEILSGCLMMIEKITGGQS